MRDLFSKLMTGSMIAGAALLVSACGGSETANTAETNMTEMNSMDTTMEAGSMNDVTAVDGAMADTNMSMDANMAAPMDSMGNTSTEGNMTTNAM
jgi:hypothetical protein